MTKTITRFFIAPRESIKRSSHLFFDSHPTVSGLLFFVGIPMIILTAMILLMLLIDIPLGIMFHW